MNTFSIDFVETKRERKVIQVFHAQYVGLNRGFWLRSKDEAMAIWCRMSALSFYCHVAEVNTNDLEVAFEKTNNIDESWHENKEVTSAAHVVANRGCRSTSVGDIAVRGNEVWFCAPIGWERMI